MQTYKRITIKELSSTLWYIYVDIHRIILRMNIILTSKSSIPNTSLCKTIRIYLKIYKKNQQRNHCIFLSDKRSLNQLCIESFYTIEFKIAQLNSTELEIDVLYLKQKLRCIYQIYLPNIIEFKHRISSRITSIA